MQTIEDIKIEVAKIEIEAATLGDDKVALYDLLVQAFFLQKDLIVLLEKQQPQVVVKEDTDKLEELTFEFTELKEKLTKASASVDILEQIRDLLKD